MHWPLLCDRRSLLPILVALPVATFVVALLAPATAGPPYLEFVDGLRNRGYEDMALYELDQLTADPAVPPDLKAVLDYERAVTLLRMARTQTSPDAQAARLNEATAALERFIAAQPNHPLVPQANTERGRILLGRAEVATIQAKSPGNAGKADDLRTEARGYVTAARDIFEKARAKYQEQWTAFGSFIDSSDAEKRASRNVAENRLIKARLDLAESLYREAQTYPPSNAKRVELLKSAADAYEAIHTDFRTQSGGLYARIWQGKSFEEMAPRPEDTTELAGPQAAEAKQKLGIAEAIYTELLEHDTREHPEIARLQELAFWFRLIVRNHPLNHDYRLVVDQASDWLKTRKGAAAAGNTALGIRWERAQAAYKLSTRPDVPESERSQLLRQALGDTEFLTAYPGEFRDVARDMGGKIKVSLGRGGQDPDTFEAAFALAQSLVGKLGDLQAAIKDAKKPEDKKYAEQALAAHLDETARVLRLALALAGSGADAGQLNRARYNLALVEYYRENLYDAAVLGEFVARRYQTELAGIALDSAFLAMAAYTKLYTTVPKGQDKTFELAHLTEIADFLATAFPDSEQATEARTNLGKLYKEQGDHQQAADWFAKVPASAAKYPESQMNAGQELWSGYAAALAKPQDQRPDAAALDALKAQAAKYLQTGLTAAEAKLSKDTPAPPDVAAARVTLAQLANLEGQYADAIKRLTAGPQPVTEQIKVKDEKKRPARGVTSGPFATLALQQLLRAYIGTQQIDPALAQMKALEQIGGEGNTQVFVSLGRQIQQEIEGMTPGPEREKVVDTFDQFLGKLSGLSQGQTYSSLLWIAETYYGLAGAADAGDSAGYFDQAAAAYGTILDKADDANFLPTPTAVPGVKLRLAEVEQSRGNDSRAYELVTDVLGANAMALDAQVVAARVLQDWGTGGGTDAPAKLLTAINGDKAKNVWGWGQIASRLQGALETRRDDEKLRNYYTLARYEIPNARRAYAATRPDRKDQDAELGRAEKELLAFVATTPRDSIGDASWEKLDALYRGLQGDRGAVVIKPLEPPTDYTSVAVPATAAVTETKAAPPATAAAPAAVPAEKGTSFLPLLIGLVFAGGAAGGVFYMMKGKKSPPRRNYGVATDSLVLPPSDSGSRKPVVSAKAAAARTARKQAAAAAANPGAPEQGVTSARQSARPPATRPPASGEDPTRRVRKPKPPE